MSEIGRIIEAVFPGVKVIPKPDINLINQLLKLSETDKDKATKHLISLFKPAAVNNNKEIVDESSPKLCKDFVEAYLSKPYLVYDPKDNHRLVTKEVLERSKK
jgi:hypothetical protein